MKSILVAVDFSDVTARVMDVGSEYARALGAQMILLHVAEPEPEFVGFEAGPVSVRDDIARTLRVEHRDLKKCKAQAEAEGVSVRALQVQGFAGDMILQEAARHEASLIVLGSHGHGQLLKLLAGSVAEHVLKHAIVPVLIVPSRGTPVEKGS